MSGFMGAARAAALLLALSTLGACASIVEGTDQSVTVTTEPSGAKCELIRASQTIAVVNPTPGTVQVDKSKNHIAVECEKEDHEKAAGTLASSFQGMTFGNILFGGVIGVAIDASSGAMNKYPPQISLVLPPVSFPTPEARDSYYDGLVKKTEAEAESQISKIYSRCGSPNSTECEAEVKLIESSRDARLSELDAMRSRARIGSS